MMDQLPPKPANTVFGIEIDGRRDRTGFSSIARSRTSSSRFSCARAEGGDFRQGDRRSSQTPVVMLMREVPA